MQRYLLFRPTPSNYWYVYIAVVSQQFVAPQVRLLLADARPAGDARRPGAWLSVRDMVGVTCLDHVATVYVVLVRSW